MNNELFTVKPSLKQYYGRTVTKEMRFDESTDNGESFERLGGSNVPRRSFDEHMILELKDGSLAMFVRTEYGIGVSYSFDSGKTWTDVRLFCDYGGKGRDDGAAAIDGSLLYDEETDTLFQLFSHTSRGIGAFTVSSQSGFDDQGRKRLWDRDDREYYLGRDGRVYTPDGIPTNYTVGSYGRLYKNGQPCGSICHGENRELRQADVSFLLADAGLRQPELHQRVLPLPL